jgi:2-amino-4-hydroxy-6-hydroxymethyldihydropteridine diphosphokinase
MIDDKVIDTQALTIPHPELHNRRFALLPLAEIAPLLNHPVLEKSISELLVNCPDSLDVQKK